MKIQVVATHTEVTQETTGVATINQMVFDAMEVVPRPGFVPAEVRDYAHSDRPLPIGWDKTISQPFITAPMSELLGLVPGMSVLEVGTGLGYHTALLSRLAGHVNSVEIFGSWPKRRLSAFGCENSLCKVGNGYNGWPKHAPFDRIIVAAAPELIPSPLLEQLKPGGYMVLPVGHGEAQQLL